MAGPSAPPGGRRQLSRLLSPLTSRESPFERQIHSPSSHQALSLYMLLITAQHFAFTRRRSSRGLTGG